MAPDTASLSGGSLLLAWQLKDKSVLIVGGGDVASGRIESVLVADARIILIAPRAGLHPLTKQFLDTSDRITYHDRVFAGPQDLEGVDMVLTAIDDVEVSRQICALCRERKIPVNVADIPPSCDFYFGSQIRSGPLQIMISTNGRSPKLANIIREVGKRRMRWMVDVCSSWDMDELALLDDNMMARLLDEGWEKNTVPRIEDVGGHNKKAADAHSVRSSSLLPTALGFVAGVACTAVVLLTRRH
ncbi:siroheme synthase [Cerioporus squamosus]|nr:siroheme synthase [Cerioporus squamosus]